MKMASLRFSPHWALAAGVVFFLITAAPVLAGAASSHFDFEGSMAREWTTPETYSIEGNKVLGLFNDKNKKYPWMTHLNLKDLLPNTAVTVSFDLYLVGTWDSGGQLSDRWVLSVENGPKLLELTKFPSSYADKEEKSPVGNKGAVIVGSRELAYWVTSQTVVVPSEHIARGALSLRFEGFLTGRKTEFWGLDNVSVKIGE